MKPYSLRRRLLIWLLAGSALVGLLALADTWREALRTAQGVSDRVLAGSALAIAERVTVDETGGLEVDIPYSSLEMLASTAQDRVFYRVDAPQGRFLTGYDTLGVVPLTAGDSIAFADASFDGTRIRSATLLRSLSTGREAIPFTVTVAESTIARDALARRILIRSALRLALMILSVVTIVWVAATLALRPLDRLVAAIAERSPDDLRPLRPRNVAEVNLLVDAVNGFMQRLETALAALKNFTGNASHQLRTPMAVLRTQLALVSRSASVEDSHTARQKAEEALVRAERVLSQLLVLARVDASAGGAALVTTDVVAVAKSVTAELVPAAIRQGIDLGYSGAEIALAHAEPVLLAELLRNLIDNALRYAGKDAVVTLRVEPQADGILLTVEDNGPGLPVTSLAKTSMLRRGAPRQGVADTGTGYGLGLAIAAEIAALFGSELSLAPGKDGRGLAASLVLPFPAQPG